jgi:hypothetical protein
MAYAAKAISSQFHHATNAIAYAIQKFIDGFNHKAPCAVKRARTPNVATRLKVPNGVNYFFVRFTFLGIAHARKNLSDSGGNPSALSITARTSSPRRVLRSSNAAATASISRQ